MLTTSLSSDCFQAVFSGQVTLKNAKWPRVQVVYSEAVTNANPNNVPSRRKKILVLPIRVGLVQAAL